MYIFFVFSYRGLEVSTKLYLNTFKMVSSHYVTFDLLNQYIERVVRSSPILRFVKKVIGEKYVIVHRSKSYDVQTENGIEKFEKVTIKRLPIVLPMYVFQLFQDYKIFICAFGMFFLAVVLSNIIHIFF